ncbi:peptidase M16 [Steroidobacter agaridevorans]|uniref:Peptidase M16 n=1 Tax=Steroidobacter agaridevorans TaxID=2695856 RepID=A0A829Y5C0_9GAMM|nr:pitrilysin family protein [Steroidobacter agaridevorans]GFE78158.1 peptidase M16 [Steroidobacter agaridevorans]
MNKVTHKTAVLALLSSLLIMQASAQAPTSPGPAAPAGASTKGVELKGKVPVNPQTLRVQLPKPQEAVLKNGLRVSLLEDHKLPTFSMQLYFNGGGLADPADKRGVAMVTASQLREGTKQRSSREIAEQLATLGAALSSTAGPASGESVVSVTGLSDNVEQTLAIASDVIRNPTFPASELDKFRARFLAQLQIQRANPGFQAQEQFMRAIYGEHPGALVVPSEAVIKGLSSADLAAFHAARYRPNNAFLIAHGDITLKELVAKLEHHFGDWAKADLSKVSLPPPKGPEKARVLLVDRPGSVQTSLWIGSLGIERNSDDYFAMLVMNHILGGGPASRLFMNLREDKGYTYGVYSSFTGTTFPGVVVASTDVRTAVTEGAMHELDFELQRIANEPVTERELTNARRALIGRFALSLDSPLSLMGNLATQKIYRLPADYWDTYPQRVEAITPADIQRVAKKYYDRGQLQIIAVGDAKQVGKVLEKYGAVEPATPM